MCRVVYGDNLKSAKHAFVVQPGQQSFDAANIALGSILLSALRHWDKHATLVAAGLTNAKNISEVLPALVAYGVRIYVVHSDHLFWEAARDHYIPLLTDMERWQEILFLLLSTNTEYSVLVHIPSLPSEKNQENDDDTSQEIVV